MVHFDEIFLFFALVCENSKNRKKEQSNQSKLAIFYTKILGSNSYNIGISLRRLWFNPVPAVEA